MNSRGAAPRPSTVREMADLLLATRGSTPPPSVGQNWVTKFVKRHPLLSSRFSKRYDYQRAKCEDPKIISEWFSLVQKTILTRVRQKPQNRKTKPPQTAKGLVFGASFRNHCGLWFSMFKPQWFLGPQWFDKQCKPGGSLPLHILCSFALFPTVINLQVNAYYHTLDF